jgi:hypothetical protein
MVACQISYLIDVVHEGYVFDVRPSAFGHKMSSGLSSFSDLFFSLVATHFPQVFEGRRGEESDITVRGVGAIDN